MAEQRVKSINKGYFKRTFESEQYKWDGTTEANHPQIHLFLSPICCSSFFLFVVVIPVYLIKILLRVVPSFGRCRFTTTLSPARHVEAEGL
jgi:hypothetical protein